MTRRLLVDVDVERPVGEAERLRELVARRRALGLRAAAAARCEQAGERQQCAAGGRAPQQLFAREDIGHSAPSIESTTKVESGLQLSVIRCPDAAPFRPG